MASHVGSRTSTFARIRIQTYGLKVFEAQQSALSCPLTLRRFPCAVPYLHKQWWMIAQAVQDSSAEDWATMNYPLGRHTLANSTLMATMKQAIHDISRRGSSTSCGSSKCQYRLGSQEERKMDGIRHLEAIYGDCRLCRDQRRNGLSVIGSRSLPAAKSKVLVLSRVRYRQPRKYLTLLLIQSQDTHDI